MGKSKQITDTVFSDIVEDKAYYKFLEMGGVKETDQLIKCKELYTQIITKNEPDLEMLAKLEEVIIQIRCRNIAKKDEVKIYQVAGGYIYARAPFFRVGKKTKDIRVVLRALKTYMENYNVLYADKKFLSMAREKLDAAMDREITKNLNILRKLHEKYLVHCETDK